MEGQETKLERQVESSSRGVSCSAEKFALYAVNSCVIDSFNYALWKDSFSSICEYRNVCRDDMEKIKA